MTDSKPSVVDLEQTDLFTAIVSADRSDVVPIRLLGHVRPYHLSNPDSPHANILFEFVDRTAALKRSLVPASTLSIDRRFIDHFSDRFFDWSKIANPSSLIRGFRKDPAPSNGFFTFVPGWHGERYSRGREWFAPEGDYPPIHFQESQSVKLGRFLKAGTADQWRKKISSYAQHSSRIRLLIALPFAATILRLLDMSPFGIMVVGPSSIGKTLLLKMAASVMGHLGSEGLTTLGSSMPAIREMVLGHRDGLLPLDEVGEIAGDEKRLQEFSKQLSFLAGKSRAFERAGAYESSVGAVKADTRVIMAMASEVSLASIAKSSGRPRLRGEEVRIMELPAIPEGCEDIFDGPKAGARIGKGPRDRSKKVQRLAKACSKYQGQVHTDFLEKLMRDGEVSARAKLKKYVATFVRNAEALSGDRARTRIIESFAVIYAAARLAIGYKVLNWKVAPTGNAILKCLRDVLSGLEPSSALVNAKSDEDLVREFLLRLSKADFCQIQKGKKTSRDYRKLLVSADVLRRNGSERDLLLKADKMRVWFSDSSERLRLIKALQVRKLLAPGRDAKTATRQIRITQLGKARTFFYVLRIAEVQAAVSERRATREGQ
jgi:hypothetical protein